MTIKKALVPNFTSPDYWQGLLAEARLAFSLLRDERVPLYLKAVPFLVGIYLLSPLDLVPGFIPIVGQLDDFAVLLMGIKLFTRLVPDDVAAAHKLELATDKS